MAHHIVGLDVSEIGRLLEPRHLPIQMLHPGVEFGITIISFSFKEGLLVSNRSNVAFEMLYVDGIESDDGDVQTNVRFSEFIAEQVFPRRLGEHVFETIQ